MNFTKFIEPILLEPGVIDSFMKVPNAKDAIDALYFSLDSNDESEVNKEKFYYFWNNFDKNRFCEFVATQSKRYIEHVVVASNMPMVAYGRLCSAISVVIEFLNLYLNESNNTAVRMAMSQWIRQPENCRKFWP